MSKIASGNSEAAIFARMWDESGLLTKPFSRKVSKLTYSKKDRKRISELSRKNSAGTITKTELEEYDNYIKVGDLMSILQLRARRTVANRNGA